MPMPKELLHNMGIIEAWMEYSGTVALNALVVFVFVSIIALAFIDMYER